MGIVSAALFLGATFGLGVGAAVVGLRTGTEALPGPGWRWIGSRTGLAVLGGGLALVATGWPVAAVAGAAAGAMAPGLVA
ncbi:MAG: hypothetical protein ACRD03_15890, partial [Acidimicrobiales bacterium]